MFEESEPVLYIRRYWSTQGIEVVGSDDRTITVTLGTEVEDLSEFIDDLHSEFGLEADYRFNAESKLGTLILTKSLNHRYDQAPDSPDMHSPCSPTMFFACTTAALSVLSTALLYNSSALHIPMFGTF